MPDPIASLLLVLALAAGLGAAIVVAQHVQTGPSAFHRYYLTHILLFNLLILAGLVFRHVNPAGQPLHPAATFFMFLLMAALKIGWLYAFISAARLLERSSRPQSEARKLARAGLGLFAAFILAFTIGWFASLPFLLQPALMGIELLVLGGAAAASLKLLLYARGLPKGGRRSSLLTFGLFHLVLLLIVLGALLASWLRPGPEEFAQLAVNAGFLLLFNLFPPLWMRRRPVASAGPGSALYGKLGITPRERQVIALIRAGRTNQEIADELFISLATVKDHNNKLFRKCGVRNRVELANLFR